MGRNRTTLQTRRSKWTHFDRNSDKLQDGSILINTECETFTYASSFLLRYHFQFLKLFGSYWEENESGQFRVNHMHTPRERTTRLAFQWIASNASAVQRDDFVFVGHNGNCNIFRWFRKKFYLFRFRITSFSAGGMKFCTRIVPQFSSLSSWTSNSHRKLKMVVRSHKNDYVRYFLVKINIFDLFR